MEEGRRDNGVSRGSSRVSCGGRASGRFRPFLSVHPLSVMQPTLVFRRPIDLREDVKL